MSNKNLLIDASNLLLQANTYHGRNIHRLKNVTAAIVMCIDFINDKIEDEFIIDSLNKSVVELKKLLK